MGIIHESVRFGGLSISEWAQDNRLQFDLTVAVQADNGLSLGAFTRARITSGTTGARVWVEARNLRLTFGNVDGAIRGAGVSHGYAGGCGVGYVGGHSCGDTGGLVGLATLGLVPTLFTNGGVIQPGQTQGCASTGGGPAARIRIDYAFGDTRIALSSDRNAATEIGIRTRLDAVTLALGYLNRASLLATTAVAPGSITGFNGDPLQVPGSVLALSGHYNGGTWGVGLLAVQVSNSGLLSPLSHTNAALSGTIELGGGTLMPMSGASAMSATWPGWSASAPPVSATATAWAAAPP